MYSRSFTVVELTTALTPIPWRTVVPGSQRPPWLVVAIAVVARNVVLADFTFTTPAGIVQPLSGIALAHLMGWPLLSPWLVATYALYLLAFACWAPVVVLQIRARDLAAEAARRGERLPPAYHRIMRWWFWLGWPAFLALIAIFALMVAKPDLW